MIQLEASSIFAVNAPMSRATYLTMRAKRLARVLFPVIVSVLLGFASDLHAQSTGAHPHELRVRQQLKGHLTPSLSRAKAIGRVPPATEIRLSIGLPVTNPSALDTFLKNVADPASPRYRKYLTSQEFTARFAPSPSDYQTLIDWAKDKKLSIVLTHPNRLLLDVSGRAADIERAFDVDLEYALRADASQFYRPNREPSLDLRTPVLSITGLDDFAQPKHHGGSSSVGNYISSDLRRAYVPGSTLTGAGQSLGILAFDGYNAADVAQYQILAGIPHLVPTNMLAGGATGLPSGSFVETVADIELALAMAPALANLTVYIGKTCNDRDSLLNLIAMSVPRSLQNSTSFGCGPGPNTIQIFDVMVSQGQSFFVPSGDQGGYASNAQVWGVAKVTVVGGTTLTMNGAGASYQSEVTWANGAAHMSSGGGVEFQIPIPFYQQGTTFSAQSGGSSMNRNDPDVSMVAKDLFIVSTSPNANGFEGTSASAPLWAGFMALVNEQNAANGLPPVWASPAIWNIGRTPAAYAVGMNDITTGTATSYISGGITHGAVVGYDLATGWGTPKSALIDQMACVVCSGTTATVGTPPMCTRLQTDPNNCGTCGHTCGPPGPAPPQAPTGLGVH